MNHEWAEWPGAKGHRNPGGAGWVYNPSPRALGPSSTRQGLFSSETGCTRGEAAPLLRRGREMNSKPGVGSSLGGNASMENAVPAGRHVPVTARTQSSWGPTPHQYSKFTLTPSIPLIPPKMPSLYLPLGHTQIVPIPHLGRH